MKERNTVQYAVAAAFAVMIVCYLAFQRIKTIPGHSKALSITAKCAATAMAVVAALIGCIKNPQPAYWIILAGLAVCTIADGVLCVRFITGGAIFGLGHVLYIVAFCVMHRPTWASLILFAALLGLVTAFFSRYRKRIGRRLPLILGYATLLCLMVSMALPQKPLFFAGALLFAASDALLAYLAVDRNHMWLDYISLGAYYLGQFLLALAIVVG